MVEEDRLLMLMQKEIDRRLVARLVWRAHSEGLPPFAYLPKEIDALAEMNGMVFDDELGAWGYFPQMSLLETIFDTYPNASYILNVRNMTRWVKSVTEFLRMRDRMTMSELHNLPRGVGDKDEDFVPWVENHHERLLEEARRRNIRLLVFDIEKHGAKELSDFLGLDVTWGQHNCMSSIPYTI